jgi:hypothetical protein
MYTKEQIIEELRRTAKENAGRPLGRNRFSKETGISENQMHKYWPSFSAAQLEAGLAPNALQTAYEKDFLLESIISLIKEINKFPTTANLKMKRHHDETFPSPETFRRFGNKNSLVSSVLLYAKNKGISDVVAICESETKNATQEEDVKSVNNRVGEVYLFKHGKYFKIGKTNNTVRRGAELRIQLPEELVLIHSIKTDDPSGIENYWHRRFANRRMNGEWFNLSTSDLRAFKSWKKIF